MMQDLERNPVDHHGAGTAGGRWKLEIKSAMVLATVLLLVVLALSLTGYGADGRAGEQQEVAPVTDRSGVPATKVVDR